MQQAAREAKRIRERIQRGLQEFGTDVAKNEREPQGDGDQSELLRLSREKQQFYRDIFGEGGDINDYFPSGLASDFAVICMTGNVARAKKMLMEADQTPTTSNEDSPHSQAKPSESLIRLLETRETAMRLSPLLMIVSAGKNFSSDDDSTIRKNQIQVAELLLSYGARPDARDVCGKTVCHYGAGMMATEMTMAVVEMAVKAYETSFMFGKEVELTGLSRVELNGCRGIARGYQAGSGRRAVYLYKEKKQIAIKPENIKLVEDDDSSIGNKTRNLCDIQCRLGTVSLHETIPTNRADVADFLVNKLGARIDIEDCDGISPKSMAMTGVAEMLSPAATVIKKAATNRGRAANKANKKKCANCDKPEPEGTLFDQCSRCRQVCYCGRSCQVAHWKASHKKECKDLAVLSEKGVKLQKPPPGGVFSTTINQRHNLISAPTQNADGFRRPRHVAVGETFFVKVQGGGPQTPLMIYDKTRECMFDYSPGLPGFAEMREKVNAEPAFGGRKTYMKASFDDNGDCTVYPLTATLKKW